MPKDDKVYVGHMLDMAQKALLIAGGKGRAEFDRDEVLQLALTHLLQVIGEAAARVSAEFKAAHRGIPWEAIVGMRHKVVHDYLSVDHEIVWDTVTGDLGPLVAQLQKLVPQDG